MLCVSPMTGDVLSDLRALSAGVPGTLAPATISFSEGCTGEGLVSRQPGVAAVWTPRFPSVKWDSEWPHTPCRGTRSPGKTKCSVDPSEWATCQSCLALWSGWVTRVGLLSTLQIPRATSAQVLHPLPSPCPPPPTLVSASLLYSALQAGTHPTPNPLRRWHPIYRQASEAPRVPAA